MNNNLLNDLSNTVNTHAAPLCRLTEVKVDKLNSAGKILSKICEDNMVSNVLVFTNLHDNSVTVSLCCEDFVVENEFLADFADVVKMFDSMSIDYISKSEVRINFVLEKALVKVSG